MPLALKLVIQNNSMNNYSCVNSKLLWLTHTKLMHAHLHNAYQVRENHRSGHCLYLQLSTSAHRTSTVFIIKSRISVLSSSLASYLALALRGNQDNFLHHNVYTMRAHAPDLPARAL